MIYPKSVASRRRFFWAPLLLMGGVLFFFGNRTNPSQAADRTVPTRIYHFAFSPFYEGEYRDALKTFRSEGRGAIRNAQTRWIDSICYHTMSGECYYHMGRLGEALEHYSAALELYCAFSDWMIRVQFAPSIRPANPGQMTQIPWGRSSRKSRPGHYPKSTLISQGRIDNTEQVEKGGIVQRAVLFPVEVQEIVRCTTLAIRRRTELMGPACQHDPLTAQLLAKLSRRPGPPNHWSEAWIDVQLGLAQIASGRAPQAVSSLQRGLMAAGEFDHPMTSIALLELGKLALERDHYPAAAKYFEEASYSAAQYFDGGVLEEAFAYGALTHLVSGKKGIYPPLAAAAGWAKLEKLRRLRVSLLLLLAENHIALGQTDKAAALLDEARLTIGRRDMGSGRLGARLHYLEATVLFRQKKIAEGDAALAAVMNYMKTGSHWLFQIGLADRLYTSGLVDTQQGVTARVAMELYNTLLRDPGPADWTRQPMESLAVLKLPYPLAIEHWFEVALRRKEHEKALEITDRHRRHRFFSTLAFGGRLQSLRWLLEGPAQVLDQESQLHRQDLLARYADYDKLSKRAGQLQEQLRKMPLEPNDPGTAEQQKTQLAELSAVSRSQEAILREIAVRREPAKLVFPPLRTTKEVQEALPQGHAMLAFFATSRHLYGFLLNNERYDYWQMGSPALLNKRLSTLLREMGHYEQNRELTTKELENTKWREPAQAMLKAILEGSKADFSKKFDELVIVPDGALWYVPFEALQVETDTGPQALLSRFRIRYAPTVSLAIADGRGRKLSGNTAVAVGRLYPRDGEDVARRAFESLAQAVPGAVALQSPLPAPSAIYSVLFDRLIVLDDIVPPERGPYDWPPVPLERGKPGNTLGDWLPLPFGGPEVVVLPGFHTAAENALKRFGPAGPGNEIFLSACAFMSCGARTIVLSRWRAGGRTAFEVVREFAQELPHTSPVDAMQRALLLTAESRLDPEAEPRVKSSATDEALKASHPFFWAGYLLLDPGSSPAKAEKAPALGIPELDQPEKEPDPQ